MLRRLLAAAVLLGAPLASAQTPVSVGTPLDGELDGTEPALYTLSLGADQFVRGVVDQHTVDVVVMIRSPEGTTIARHDEPARGPEPFAFTTRAAGEYTIAVTPYEGADGRYTLRVDTAEPLADTPEGRVRQMLTLRTGDAPGALVAVARDGEVVYREAFGQANLTHDVPMTLDTRTNIGSTSKQFTAYAIALLAERGELDLDDDVRTHIPELPDLGETVTLRHLLGHTSGYREFLNTLRLAGRPLGEGGSLERSEIIGVVQRQPRLQNTPGAEWNYNNTGYALLATVVERVSGQDFPDWMAENVFRPNGMTDTVVRATPWTLVENSAQGYERGESGVWNEVADIGGAPGAGAIYSTVGDLMRWTDVLLGGGAHPEIVEQMTTPGTLNDGEATPYGLGLFIDDMNGVQRIHHGGADNAHRSMLAVFPELGASVVVLTNSNADTGALAGRTMRAFFPDAFATEDTPDAEPDAALAGDYAFEDALFDDYAGRYAMDAMTSFVLTFKRGEDGGYLTQATGQGELEIVPTSDSTFTLTAVDAGVTFHRDADGVVRSATLHQNGNHRATRLDLEEAAPLVLEDYVGRFWSDELETAYTLRVEDGELVATHRRLGDMELGHATGDTFTMQSVRLDFERDASGDVVAFVVDGGRTRDIRFDLVR